MATCSIFSYSWVSLASLILLWISANFPARSSIILTNSIGHKNNCASPNFFGKDIFMYSAGYYNEIDCFGTLIRIGFEKYALLSSCCLI